MPRSLSHDRRQIGATGGRCGAQDTPQEYVGAEIAPDLTEGLLARNTMMGFCETWRYSDSPGIR